MKQFAVFFFVAAAMAQQNAPPDVATQQVLIYSGSSAIAICEALSTVTTGLRAATSVAISAVSKASAAVVTSTGHGFDAHSRPVVTITGATGTGWTGINATWTATIIDADTFSIPIDSSGFGALGGTVTFITTAPRKTMPEWSVRRLAYDGSGNMVFMGWLNGTAARTQLCSNASSTTLTQQ